MKFTNLEIPGLKIIEPKLFWDDRGFFTEATNIDLFKQNGIDAQFVRSAVSYNPKKSTLRGLHYQTDNHAEAKLVQVFKGSIFDAVIDLRKDSPTYLKTFTIELSEKNRKILFVPRGLAHGFLTLEDETIVNYQLDNHYAPNNQAGLRYDDAAFKINWLSKPSHISDKDLGFSAFK
jgi:dTDP-4-dehydrorhamnose 3,5-epimerase